jgi:hypothetical protein
LSFGAVRQSVIARSNPPTIIITIEMLLSVISSLTLARGQNIWGEALAFLLPVFDDKDRASPP